MFRFEQTTWRNHYLVTINVHVNHHWQIDVESERDEKSEMNNIFGQGFIHVSLVVSVDEI